MAQVYVSQVVNVYLRSGAIVTFMPGINTVPAGTESDPFMANLINATADQVAARAIIDGGLVTAANNLAAAEEAVDIEVATTQAEVLTAKEVAGETWATNHQAAIDAGEPYNVRHPDPVVASAIAITAHPSQVAGSGFIQPLAAPVNTDVPAVLHNGAVVATAAVGDTLTCTMGNWLGEPTGYSYQWQSGGTAVGTNSSSYTIVAGDATHSVNCVVTATNAVGSTAAPPSNGVSIP